MEFTLTPETLRHNRPCERYNRRLPMYRLLRSAFLLGFVLLMFFSVLMTKLV